MRARLFRRDPYRLREIRHRFFDLVLFEQEDAHVDEWSGIFLEQLRLPGNCVAEGGERFRRVSQSLVSESEIVFRLNVFRIQLQTPTESGQGFLESIFVVLGAS